MGQNCQKKKNCQDASINDGDDEEEEEDEELEEEEEGRKRYLNDGDEMKKSQRSLQGLGQIFDFVIFMTMITEMMMETSKMTKNYDGDET